MENVGMGLLIIGLTLVGIFAFMLIDEARARRRQRWELIKELDRQARVNIRIGDRGDLIITAHNRAGVSAARVLALWFELEPPDLMVGDSVSFEQPIDHEAAKWARMWDLATGRQREEDVIGQSQETQEEVT